jgi:hypothetical protein
MSNRLQAKIATGDIGLVFPFYGFRMAVIYLFMA